MKKTWLLGALAAVLVPFAVPGAAGATTPPGQSVLVLTVAAPEEDAKAVALTCEPAGGTHPSAKVACRELRSVNGDFDSLPPHHQPAACTLEYAPVTAVAHGVWRGKRVSWEREFSNRCVLRAETGRVFQF